MFFYSLSYDKGGEISDIDAILNITKSCALHMIQNNIYQWNEHYPDRGSFINDAENQELYVYVIMACGCMYFSLYAYG